MKKGPEKYAELQLLLKQQNCRVCGDLNTNWSKIDDRRDLDAAGNK